MLGIDDWLFRNADWHICNKDCVHCVEEDCEDRLLDYDKGENYETIKQISTKD